MRRIILADASAQSREALARLLEERGFKVHLAANGRTALALLRRHTVHALILGLELPDMEGLSVLEAVLAERAGLPVIVVTGRRNMKAAVGAMKLGACDVMTKPVDPSAMVDALDRRIERARAVGAVPPVRSRTVAEMEKLGIIGHSDALLRLFETLKRIAPHQSLVLITGESGTGKELFARALHALGSRAGGPFVPVNCASLSQEILENELFGHERGAFTGADRAKAGVMELADHGTLFLDEVSEMGLGCQAKLLRVLERREFRRVGGTSKIKIDVSVVAACNVDIEARVLEGSFRPDLYYRLNVVTIDVPPLRERKEAIPILADRFLSEIAQRIGTKAKSLTPAAKLQLARYDWPGNVRQLRNCMESLTLVTRHSALTVADLPPTMRGAHPAEVRVTVGMRMEEVEREVLRLNLASHATIKDAARSLGIPLRTFHDKLKRYALTKG